MIAEQVRIVSKIMTFVIGIIILFYFYSRYKKKPNIILKYLVIIYIFSLSQIIISFLGDYIMFFYGKDVALLFYSGVDSSFIFSGDDPDLIYTIWRILYGFTTIILLITTFTAYKFYIETFEKESNSKGTKFMKYYAISLFVCGILSMFSPIDLIPDFIIGGMNFGHDFGYYFRLLATTFGLIFNIIVYLPFAYLAFKTYYRVKETVKADNFQEKHTKGFFWIGIMAVCYVLSNLELFIEGIIVGFFNIPAESMYVITGIFSGIFTVIGYISAYLGYIKPGKTEN